MCERRTWHDIPDRVHVRNVRAALLVNDDQATIGQVHADIANAQLIGVRTAANGDEHVFCLDLLRFAFDFGFHDHAVFGLFHALRQRLVWMVTPSFFSLRSTRRGMSGSKPGKI